MTKVLLEIPLTDDGSVVMAESTAPEGSSIVNAAAESGLVVKVEKSLNETLSSLGPFTDLMLEKLSKGIHEPKTIVLELGIKFGAKGNIIIAGGEAEANCKITLT